MFTGSAATQRFSGTRYVNFTKNEDFNFFIEPGRAPLKRLMAGLRTKMTRENRADYGPDAASTTNSSGV